MIMKKCLYSKINVDIIENVKILSARWLRSCYQKHDLKDIKIIQAQ